MAKTIMKLSVEHSRYKIMNELDFNDFYKVYYTYTYKRNEDINRVYVDGTSGSCIFCGGKIENGAKFSKDAHVIPAFFGSPKLFSKNECDKCNQYFGDELENSLAKMLNPILLISGVLPRCGPIKKIKGQGVEVSFHRDSGVEVKSHLEMKMDLDEGHVNIPIPSEAYNPQKALRSLLHAFWMIVDDTTRNSYSWIKDSLFDLNIEVPSVLYLGLNMNDEPNRVSLNVFKLKIHNESLCEFILKLTFNSSCLYYGIYQGDFKNILTQDFLIDDLLPIFPIFKIIDFKDSFHVNSKIQYVQYSYKECEDGKTGIKSKPKRKDEYPVGLFVNYEGKRQQFEGITTMAYYDEDFVVVGGGNFTAKIVFRRDGSSSFHFEPDGCLIVDIKKTIDFLRLINDCKNFTISHPSYGDIVDINGTMDMNLNLSFIKYIDTLCYLSIKLGNDIKYADPDEQDIYNLELLSFLLNFKEVGDFRITLSDGNEFSKYYKYASNSNSKIIRFPEVSITILKRKYDLSELLSIKCFDSSQITKEEETQSIIFHNIKIDKTLKNKSN